MFDTGTRFAFFFNNHFLPLARDRFLGKGAAASGQEVVLYQQNAPLDQVELSDSVRFENLANLPHNDFGFIEQGIVERFLGTIGHGFNRNYEFVINYHNQTMDLYSLANTEQVARYQPEDSKIVAKMAFHTTGVDGYMPEVALTVGSDNGTPLTDVHNLRLTIGNENRIGKGYQFLKNYISSWNYQAQTITLVLP